MLPLDPPGYCQRCGVQLVKPSITSHWPGDSPTGELYTEAKWGVNDYVRDNSYWHCQDGDSTEIEVSMLVAAFVRAHQPELVIETGTAWGQSTRFIGEALRENGHGHLVSLEIDSQRLLYSRWYCHELICDGTVSILDHSSVEYEPGQRVDMLFSDSNYELRVPELEHYYQWMEADGLVMFHDTAPGHGVHRDSMSRDLQTQIEQAMGDRFRCIRLHTPRGITILEVLDRGGTKVTESRDATIIDVHDGDTIYADIHEHHLDRFVTVWSKPEGGPDLRIRLARINAPELSTQAGRDALTYLLGQLGPLPVDVTLTSTKPFFSPDNYGGRIDAEVIVKSTGVNLSDLMLSSGHAVPYKVIASDLEDTLYYWAQRYVNSADSEPSASYDAELEYCEDNMRRHLAKGQ